jgi:hypothetical protein
MPGRAAVSHGLLIRVQSIQFCPLNERWKIVLSVPRANTSRRPCAEDVTAGPKLSAPPRDSQSLHALPVNHLCQSARSPPRTKTSILPSAQDTAAGGEYSVPPSDCQSLHTQFCGSEENLCQSAKSSPRAKTSSRDGPHEQTAGAEVATTSRERHVAICALAVRGMAGSELAPAANCRNRRRGIFMSRPFSMQDGLRGLHIGHTKLAAGDFAFRRGRIGVHAAC